MGHETLMYGFVLGSKYTREDIRFLQRLNQQVIDRLPASDDWPFLTRSMVHIPGEDFHEGTYRNHIILVGGTFKQIELHWNQWLNKFENFLRQLYWKKAKIHLETDIYGNHDYQWDADPLEWGKLFKDDPPSPIQLWTFSGGPRQFDK
jgi:hypothetical protein